jgi:hypothetical protein
MLGERVWVMAADRIFDVTFDPARQGPELDGSLADQPAAGTSEIVSLRLRSKD